MPCRTRRSSESSACHRESRETYRSTSIWSALREQAPAVGKQRVARLMRQAGFGAMTVRKWRATAQSEHRVPGAENTLDRPFTVASPNRVWAGDISFVWTTEAGSIWQ